ncbi:methyltransferase [Agaricicola taiwanensis]|uniref:Putative 4-hydroxy-4-methyl-2-oxoglutarate aldolase n=1 Tax=Agaricicola taiwanensis TaxID=591372 RepID=A0A8J3DW56_9RHOB|nr:RraA family protein [Agaricicola taiwanensis]GGE46202.1 methyltransferase [Agaricicola taiwanensis]
MTMEAQARQTTSIDTDAAARDIATFLANQPTGITVDAMCRIRAAGWIEGIRAMGGRRRLAGRVRTLLYARGQGRPPIARSIYAIIRDFDPGDVLVVSTSGANRWFLGENMTHEALYHGLSGIITDGLVRDGDELAGMDFPVFARGLGVSPPSPDYGLYGIDVPITLDGMLITPGDVIHADADGVVVVPAGMVAQLKEHVVDFAALEARQEEVIRSRAPLSELDVVLKEKSKKI